MNHYEYMNNTMDNTVDSFLSILILIFFSIIIAVIVRYFYKKSNQYKIDKENEELNNISKTQNEKDEIVIKKLIDKLEKNEGEKDNDE